MPFYPSPELGEALQRIPRGKKCSLSREKWEQLAPPPGLDYERHAELFARLIEYCNFNLGRLTKPAPRPSKTRSKLKTVAEKAKAVAVLLSEISTDPNALNALSRQRDRNETDNELKKLAAQLAASSDEFKKASVALAPGRRKKALRTELIWMLTQFLHKVLFELTGVGLSRSQNNRAKVVRFDFAVNVLKEADRHISPSMVQTAIKEALESRYDDADEWLVFGHESMLSIHGDKVRRKRTQIGDVISLRYFWAE